MQECVKIFLLLFNLYHCDAVKMQSMKNAHNISKYIIIYYIQSKVFIVILNCLNKFLFESFCLIIFVKVEINLHEICIFQIFFNLIYEVI